MILKDNINSNNIKLLIYDVDGTLVEFVTLFKLLKESFDIHGMRFKEEYFKQYVASVSKALDENRKDFSKSSLVQSFEKYFSILEKSNVNANEYLNTLLSLEYKYTQMHDGVDITLKELFSKYPQVVSTNWFADSQKTKINKFDLLKYFNRIYGCEMYYPKPNRKHFERISSDYNLSPDECLIIGDSFSDIKASAYGYNTLLVDYKKEKTNLYNLSTYVVDDFRDVSKVLARKK